MCTHTLRTHMQGTQDRDKRGDHSGSHAHALLCLDIPVHQWLPLLGSRCGPVRGGVAVQPSSSDQGAAGRRLPPSHDHGLDTSAPPAVHQRWRGCDTPSSRVQGHLQPREESQEQAHRQARGAGRLELLLYIARTCGRNLQNKEALR